MRGHGIIRQKMRDAKIQPLFGRREMIKLIGPRIYGVLLLGESKPEAPAQEERRPTAPGELIQAKRSTFFYQQL
jgi:hypothetical protein